MATLEQPKSPAMTEQKRKLTIPLKLAYGLGQAGQNGGFDVAVAFIFFYYSAVRWSVRLWLSVWRQTPVSIL